MGDVLNFIFCREPLAREIAKVAAFTIIPQAVFGSILAGVYNASASDFDGLAGKNSFIGVLIMLIAGHIGSVIYYYIKLVRRCRARREVYSVHYEPVRIRPPERREFWNDDNNNIRVIPRGEAGILV